MFQSNLIKPKNEETASGATGDILVGRIVPITKQEGLTRSQISTSGAMDFPFFPTFPNSEQEERDPSPPPAELTIGDSGGHSSSPETDSSNPAQLIPQEGEAELDNSDSSSVPSTRTIDSSDTSGSSLSQSINDDALPLIGQPMGLPTPRQNFHDIMPTQEDFPGLRRFQQQLQNTIARDAVKPQQQQKIPSASQSQLSALLSSTATAAATNNEPTQTSAFNVVDDGNNTVSYTHLTLPTILLV